MLIYHKGHTATIQVYSVTVMTHVKALQAEHSSQGTSEPVTPALPLQHISFRFTIIDYTITASLLDVSLAHYYISYKWSHPIYTPRSRHTIR